MSVISHQSQASDNNDRPVAVVQNRKVHSYIAKGLQLSQKEYIVSQWHKSHLVQHSVGQSADDDCQYTQLQGDSSFKYMVHTADDKLSQKLTAT